MSGSALVIAGNVDIGSLRAAAEFNNKLGSACVRQKGHVSYKHKRALQTFLLFCMTILVRYLSGSVVDSPERLPSHTENPAFGPRQMVIIDSGHECIFSENVCSERERKKKKKQSDCPPKWADSPRTNIKTTLVKQHCFV